MKLKDILIEKEKKISLLNSQIKDKDNQMKKNSDSLA